MSTILRIFIKDLRGICRNIFALIIAIGLCIIPSLYAWFNIYSNWDPMLILLQLRLLYTLRILVLIWMANIRIWVIVLLITSKKMTNSADIYKRYGKHN